jgi:cardiolipin synthase A/B
LNTRVLVDSGAFWSAMAADLAAARDHAYVQAMTFEADSVGRVVAAGIMDCGAADRRVLIDEFSKHKVSDRFVHAPGNRGDAALRREHADTLRFPEEFAVRGVACRFTNPAGFLLHRFPARNHKKLVVIDDRIVYVGGINFSDHNFSWHDMMLRFEDAALASFLKEDFLSTWEGRNQSRVEQVGDVTLCLCDGRRNETTFAPVIEAIGRARRSIFIESTYLTFPLFSHLRAAVGRGVHVRLITSEVNNFRDLQHYVPWEAARSGVELRLYPGRLTHLKAMLIDDEVLIAGTCNFEFLSHQLYQEIVFLSPARGLIEEFRTKVVEPDWERSLPFDGGVSGWKGRLSHLRLALASQALRVLR